MAETLPREEGGCGPERGSMRARRQPGVYLVWSACDWSKQWCAPSVVVGLDSFEGMLVEEAASPSLGAPHGLGPVKAGSTRKLVTAQHSSQASSRCSQGLVPAR